MSQLATTYAAGVALSICISSANSFGMGLQKRAHRRLLALPKAARPAASADAGWRAGLVFLACGALGSLGNYALLGQARASAMAAITIVTNAVMARLMLGERLSPIDALVAALVIAGIATSVTFGAGATGSPPIATLDELLAVLHRDYTVAIAAPLTVLLAAACELGARHLKRQREAAAAAVASGAAAGAAAAAAAAAATAEAVTAGAAAEEEAAASSSAQAACGSAEEPDVAAEKCAVVAAAAVAPTRPSARELALQRLECFLRALLSGCFSGLTGFCAKAVVCSLSSMLSRKSAADLQRGEFWIFLLVFPFSSECGAQMTPRAHSLARVEHVVRAHGAREHERTFAPR